MISKNFRYLLFALILCTVPVNAQTDSSKINDKLKYEIMILIDKAYYQNRIDDNTRDSLSTYISSSLFKTETESLYKESEILEELKSFLIINLQEPDYKAITSNSMLPGELPAPQYEKEKMFIPAIPSATGIKGANINKGVDGFYKNKSYTKSLPIGWNDDQINIDAANRAMESISRNLQGTYISAPAFIKNMSKNSSLFVRILAGFFNALNNGAQTQLNSSSITSTSGQAIPKIGQQPYRDNAVFLQKEFDRNVYNAAPVKKEPKKKNKKNK